jgi:hypothetical protein
MFYLVIGFGVATLLATAGLFFLQMYDDLSAA